MKQTRLMLSLATGDRLFSEFHPLRTENRLKFRMPAFAKGSNGVLRVLERKQTTKRIALANLDETQLLALYNRSGNKDYYGELYRRYAHLVLGTCIKYLKDPEVAQDAQMEIFHKLMDKLKHFKPGNFNGWLYRVTSNHCLEILRKEGRMPQSESIEPYAEVLSAEESNPARERKLEKIVSGLMDMIKRLPKSQQECVKLFYLERKSYKEIEEACGYGYKEVKSHIQNGKRKLKMLLIRNGYGELWNRLAD